MTATRSLSASLQHLGRTLLDDTAPDAELVGRFVARRDSAAFTALVRRYGGVVLGVCRRVLRHEQDAEDAFQATFLVLARDAANVQRAAAVGNWLYGVAHNVARKARTLRQRRAAKEREAARSPVEVTRDADDLHEILDAELAALPDKYRGPIVLCDLRGLTTQQAAIEVGCPPKTLGTRLLRGRAMLARRLTRKGVALPAAGLALPASAAVPPDLIDATARAVGSKATVTPAVAALVTGASNVMLKTTLKFAALAGVLGLTAGPLWHHLHAAPPSRDRAATGTPAAVQPPPNHLAALHALHDHLYGFVRDVFHTADDKKDKEKTELSGTWVKTEGEMKIAFEKESLKISPHGKDDILLIVCEYTADKKGLVKGKVTGLEGNEMALKVAREKLPVGTEFSFTWKVTKETAKLDEVKCEKADILKAHMEGDFGEKK